MNGITRNYSTVSLVEKMNDAGCPCGPIYNIGEAFEDEQVKHLKMQRPVTHATLGEFKLIRTPINMSAFPPPDTFDRAGPESGEHNESVLRELGLSDDEINELRVKQVI